MDPKEKGWMSHTTWAQFGPDEWELAFLGPPSPNHVLLNGSLLVPLRAKCDAKFSHICYSHFNPSFSHCHPLSPWLSVWFYSFCSPYSGRDTLDWSVTIQKELKGVRWLAGTFAAQRSIFGLPGCSRPPSHPFNWLISDLYPSEAEELAELERKETRLGRVKEYHWRKKMRLLVYFSINVI